MTGTVAQLVECLLCDREVMGSIPSQVISKTLKIVLAAVFAWQSAKDSRARNQNWSAQCQYNVTGYNMSSVWGVIFQ